MRTRLYVTFTYDACHAYFDVTQSGISFRFIPRVKKWQVAAPPRTLALHPFEISYLCVKWRKIDGVFLVNVYNGLKFCHSLLETTGIRVPTPNLRRFTLMLVLNIAAVLDARASPANAVCGYAAVLRKKFILLKDLLI
jgi:hypothetical protein